MTDSREYDSFGLSIASSGMNTPFGFAGGQGYRGDPDSGLMLLGARCYLRHEVARVIVTQEVV